MAWWNRLFPKKTQQFSSDTYFVDCELFTEDASRGAQVRVYGDGRAYFVEREWVEGITWKDREGSAEIGPYDSAEAAEIAAVNSPWFLGRNGNNA